MHFLIIKKEHCKGISNFKKIRTFKRKGIKYYICILINKLKGYEVEALDND